MEALYDKFSLHEEMAGLTCFQQQALKRMYLMAKRASSECNTTRRLPLAVDNATHQANFCNSGCLGIFGGLAGKGRHHS